MNTLPLAFLQMPSIPELLIIGAIGLLFFGKRLPEVGRSVGKGIVEFKKGLKGIDDDIEEQSNKASKSEPQPQATVLPPPASQPRFDPYTGQPLQPAFDPHTGKPLNPPNAA